MTSSGAYVLAVVCEADADRRISTALADRVLVQEVEWIERESIDHYRHWQGLEGRSFLGWTEAARLAKQKGFRVHGHFDGLPAAPDAAAARKALLLLMDEPGFPDAVLLIRDSDGDLRRRQGLEQARAGEGQWPFPIILGSPIPNGNAGCWQGSSL